MVENKVIVHIFGEDYPITGIDDPSHISRVAEYVDSMMKEAARSSRVQARDKVAILAAMSIASQLLERSGRSQLAEQKVDSVLDKVLVGLNDILAESSTGT